MRITAIPQLYRNLRRWREILGVLQRFGLADWLSRFQKVPFRDAFKDRGGVSLAEYSREQRVRMALTELGPAFIKLGQTLAARPDLVGPELAEELKRLRANVQPDSFESVEGTLTKELGEDFQAHFASVEETPLATASIGQVHRATLKDGRRVVIKVQRSGIGKTIRQDIEVLTGLAVLAERVDTLAAWGPSDIVRQLAPIITRELDFRRECHNLQLFSRLLTQHSHEVAVPLPVDALCTDKVLVMGELVGTPLNRALANAARKKSGADTANGDSKVASVRDPSVSQQLCETIASVYLTMVFDEGFFHADPHTGNLVLLENGQLGILDFGMVGRIDEALRETIEEILMAISSGDQGQLCRLIRRVGDAPAKLDESALAIDVADFVGNYGQQSLGGFDMSGALNDLSGILHRHSIKLPNQSALLLKMLISLEGTLRELGASFDSLDVVRQYAKKTMLRRLSPARRIRQARRVYLETENFAERAPDEVLQLLEQARRGEVRMTLEHSRIGPTVNRLVLGLMASAVFLGSSLMLAFNVRPLLFPEEQVLGFQQVSVLGLLGVIGSMAVMLRLLLAINRSGHLNRRNEE
ncbi:MAG: AarF/UbiB family protein [Planctomycetota bacterium]